ncbi:DinB family protein [Algoriphagus sp.]|uniref:DinB family protein n=1 Tax=Algoriphagus sp. TaxID=1872435 RepID=UPI0025FCB999|nr:DinB family protein [Algoriphagus sp.]
MKTLMQPNKGDYSDFYSSYLNLIKGDDYYALILDQIDLMINLFQEKGNKWADTAYAEGKWTPKEVLGHIIDTERIMAFRALCFARGEKSSLPGFDQEHYVLNARFSDVSIEDLLEDFVTQRISLLSLIKTLPSNSHDLVGYANGSPITPRALLWIIPGHFEHHYQIFQEKY